MATEEKTNQPFGNLINPYTNKPVQTGKGVSFNQNIYDAPNYMQQKNDILDNLNTGMTTAPASVNAQALYNIPVVPEFMNEEYQKAYEAASWLNSLNVATPDEIDEWRAKGKMGIGETAQRLKSLKSAKYVPFVGTTAEVGYNIDMLSAVNRLKKGEKVSQVEQDMLVDYLRELKEIQVRGTTLPSKALSAILESIPYFIEFGVGVAAAPETFGGGLSVSALALSKAAGKKAARKAVSKALQKAATESVMTGSKKGLSLTAAKQLYRNTYNDMLKSGATKAAKEMGAKETAKIVAKTTPQSIIAANFGSKPLTYMTAKNTIGGVADRQLAGSMQVTDAGEAVFLEPENMALSIMKSFGSSIFDNYTETMGWAFAPVTSYFAKPVRNVLPKKFFTEFEKLVTSRYGMPAAEALKKYGYDGVVEEMGEELLNRFLCDVFGIDGLEGYTIDGFLNNVFYANDPEQWLVEALSFAAMGGAAHGTHGAYSKIKEELEKQGNEKAVARLAELANKRIYSPAEFYLEQGLIKIEGSQSAAEQELRKKFGERGVDESTANQFFSNASELEIREQLRKYYEEDGQDAEKRREKAVDFLANRMLENNSYKNKDLAEKNANLFVTALEKFSETNGIAIEDLIREEAPTIRNQSEIEGAIREVAPEASTQYAEKYIEDIYNEIAALPDDYQDTEYIENQLKMADLAERIKYNTLTDEEYADANEFVNELEAADYIDLANELRAASGYEFEDNNQYMQRTEFTDDAAQVKKKEGYNQLFQSVDVAGAEGGKAADAAREWKEKGTDSKYFKKWFGDSKVVDENGKPLVVYHGTSYIFDEFDKNKLGSLTDAQSAKKGFWFTDGIQTAQSYAEYSNEYSGLNGLLRQQRIAETKRDWEEYDRLTEEIEKYSPEAQNQIVMPVYLSITNPKIFDAQNQTFMEIQDELNDFLSDIEDYDGVIISNLKDATSNVEDEAATHYMVKNPEQIKSVNNRGTFDAENPNIYYQEDYNEEKKNLVADKYKDQIKFYNGEWINRKLIEEKGIDFDKVEIGDYIDFFEESKRKQRPEYNPEIDEIAKEYFGTTNVINEAGYILRDGSKLDFSGKKDGGTPNRRNYDHREIVDAFIENEQYEDIGFNEFIDNGAIRFMPESKSMLIARKPSDEQMEALENIIALYQGEVTLELVNRMDEWGWDNNFRKSYDRFSNPKKILADIRVYYNGGKISEHKRYYQSAYHGSPYKFDEFSTDFMGKGEGAQAHGWGLYFAADKKVAQGYYDALNSSDYYYDGQRLFAVNDINKSFIESIIKDGKRKTLKNLKAEKAELEKKKNEPQDEIISAIWNYNKAYDFEISRIDAKIDFVKNFDKKKYVIKRKTDGQLFEVDVPESDVMLDEQKTISEQPEKVQKIIEQYFLDNYRSNGGDMKHFNYKNALHFLGIKTGRDLYRNIAQWEYSKYNKNPEKYEFQPSSTWSDNREMYEIASKKLNSLGIKGITYDGKEDGRCYVVFDDKAVKVLEKYYQGEEDAIQGNMLFDNEKARELRKVKGSYIPAENLIELFKNADESTVVHEFAHWWLDRLVKYSENNEELAADVEAIRKFVKNDGEEFTREQHEKFARGFETYIRSGYARNNRLKRIFEDFKNALLAIYDSIKQLGYKDDDMPQIQDLFDRLLTTERERIRATVFDKVAEIDAKIEAIKESEAKEFADLDAIYKDNIAYLDRQSEKKRSVQEYLEMAETIPFRETKETREFKKRYKDATFEILEVATGYKRQFIANPKNWEKVQAAFEATDRITATDGMHPNWREFYPDTGVSYDNDEVDGDNKLAQMAFDVMTEGSYNKTFADNFEFDEIDKFYTKFDYLNNKVKTLKGTQKRAAYEAMISLFNDLPAMPDEIIVEIFDKMNSAEDEYEHQQREDFNRMIIPSIPVMQQLQFYITRKLDALKVYNPETRYKMKLNRSHRLYRYIKDVNSVNAAKKQIRRINEYVIDDMRVNQRMLLHKEIQKQIKVNSKIVKVGTINKGKFDWKTNTVFAELVEMNKMKREDAEKELGNIVQIQDAEKGESRDSYDENETSEFNKPNDFQDNLRKKFLQYRSMRLQDLDVTHTIQLLQDILELKEKGRQAKSEEDFINKTQRWNTRNNLLDILEVTKQSGAAFGARWVAGVGKGVSLNGGTLANWESLLNALFNKDTAQKYSLLQDEAKSEIYARKHMLDFYKKAADIYGFNQANTWDRFLDYDYMQPLIKLMQEYNDEKYTYIQQVFSINSPDGYARSEIEISRAQMITMFAWSLNEQLEQRLFTQFGLQQIREMFEERLSEQDKKLAWALVDTCEGMREDINEVFIRTTGLSLPAVSNYFPSKAERVQSDIDMYHDNFVKSSNPSFIKQRKTCNRIPMKPLAPLEILIPHINKTAKYVVMSEHVNFLNQIFKDTAIKTKMQEIWGSKDGADIYQTLINKLAACTFTNYSKGTNLVAGALDTLSRNYITSSIGFSPKVAIGQLLSVINYAENMPSSEWVKGFTDTLKHPVENFKYMMENCEYLQTRLAGNSQNEIISILTSEKDKFRTLRNFMTSNVKWGDMIAITLGGKAYVDWLMQQGMTKEAAFDKFVEDTLRAQQAGTTSSISEWQSAQAKNCLTRMFFAFRNTDIQYERKFVDTLIQLKRGDIPKKEGIKKLFIYKIFNPFMFTSFLQNLSIIALVRAAFAGDDPDDIAGNFLKSAVEAVLLGGMTAYGFAGYIASSVMESLIALFDKEYKNFETDVPVMSDFDRQIQKYLKGDLTVADYIDALAMGTELGFGLPASKVVNSAEGLGDIAQGNFGVGLSRLAGWGKYTSTKAWTGKEPEKKKKKRRKK